MSDLEITITGASGSGKTVLANWLHASLYERAAGTAKIAIFDDGVIDTAVVEELLVGVLRGKSIAIRTTRVPRMGLEGEC